MFWWLRIIQKNIFEGNPQILCPTETGLRAAGLSVSGVKWGACGHLNVFFMPQNPCNFANTGEKYLMVMVRVMDLAIN